MVVKLRKFRGYRILWFESSVISYGSKTSSIACAITTEFESSVISYGSKT